MVGGVVETAGEGAVDGLGESEWFEHCEWVGESVGCCTVRVDDGSGLIFFFFVWPWLEVVWVLVKN